MKDVINKKTRVTFGTHNFGI